MSSITFDASLNTDKLDKSIKESNRTIKDWAKDIETSSRKADRSFSNVGTSLKQQKEFVKGLTDEIKAMQRAYDRAFAGAAKSKMGRELGQAKRRLSEATGELIGMQEKQIDVNSKEIESNKGLMGSIGEWALKLGGVALAYKLVKDAIGQLTVAINTFNIAGAVMKQVMYNIVTGAQSWTNGIQNAIQAQKKLNELRFEEKIYARVALKETIEYDKAITEAHDQTLTGTERIKAYDDALVHLSNVNKLRKKAVQDEIDALTDSRKFQEGEEKVLLKVMDLKNQLLVLDHRMWSGQKEVASMRSGLIKKEADDLKKAEEDKKKAIADAAKIENKIKKEQDLLAKAVEANNELEIKAIVKRLVELQKELVLRKKIADAAISAAIVREVPIGKITGLKAPTLLPGGLKTSGRLAPTYKKKEKVQTAEEYIEEQNELLEKQIELRNEIVNASANLVYQIGEQIGLDEKSLAMLDSALNAFTSLAAGDMVGAAAAMLSGIIAQIPSVASKFEAQIEHINKLLEEQSRLIELSEQTGGQKQARKEELDLLEKEKDALIARRDHIKKYGGGIFWTNKRTQKEIEELNDQIKKTENLIEDANIAYNEFLTDTTARDITDAIIQGFQEGKIAAADFADTFNDFMMKALNSALSEMLQPKMAEWYRTYIGLLKSGGGLTEQEIEHLRIFWSRIIKETEKDRENLEKITGVNLSPDAISNAGLTGIVRNMTEETGSELTGLFRRFADEQRVVKDYSIMGVNHLVGIEANTYNTVVELKNAVTELQAINSNTKQVPTGSL